MYYPNLVAKTKVAKLICIFVFAYAKSRFSCDMGHFNGGTNKMCLC